MTETIEGKGGDLLPPLPLTMQTLWPHQVKPVETITRWFREGATMVVLDAPPGAGKSLIAESVRRNLKVQALYLCQTKQLQDQLARSFPYARVIKGRDNYRTLDDVPGKTARDCDAWRKRCKANREPRCRPMGQPHCSYCHPMAACPYDLAKAAAINAPLAIANTSYAFLEWGAKGDFKDFPLVILDEWDEVENVLFNTLNVELTPRDLVRFQISLPRGPIDADWVTGAANQLSEFWDKTREDPPDDWPQIGQRAGDLKTAAAGLRDKSWLVLSQTLERGVNIGPIEVGKLGQRHLWPHGQRWLLMSGTAIDVRLRLQKLGWTDFGRPGRTMADALKASKGRYLRVPSVYPAANRPIRVWPIARMVKAQRDASIPKLAVAIAQILDNHPTERILIHTGTYDITAKLEELLVKYRTRLVTFQKARDRDDAMQRYLKQDGAVLMGPAMERGISLDDDACKVVVLCRVPYPFRGDPRVAERAKQGGLWWQLQAIETIATIVQMTMRHIRHAKDTGMTYILDAQFEKVRTHGLYANRWPAWWTESLVDFKGF